MAYKSDGLWNISELYYGLKELSREDTVYMKRMEKYTFERERERERERENLGRGI